MPTKRPDQLPEGEDFDFDDILMVEKNPDSPDRKLYKTTLRELMEAALKIDPQRMGSNAIVGTQSQFDWLMEQMNKIQSSNLTNVDSYDEYDSPTKELEKSYITPTPTPTPSITSTVPAAPVNTNLPQPTPLVTPTPSVSSKPLTKELKVKIDGPQAQVFDLPFEYSPVFHGYSNWRIKAGSDTDNVYVLFNGFFPDDFQPSGAGEKLSVLKVQSNKLNIQTVIPGDLIEFFNTEGPPKTSQGLIMSSKIEFTIILF